MTSSVDPTLPTVAILVVDRPGGRDCGPSRDGADHGILNTARPPSSDRDPPVMLQAELKALVKALGNNGLNASMLALEEDDRAPPDIILVLLPHLGHHTGQAKQICIRIQDTYPRASVIQSHPMDAPYSQLRELRPVSPAHRYGANPTAICRCINNTLAQQNISRECYGRTQSIKKLNETADTPTAMPSVTQNIRLLVTGDAGKHFLELKNIFLKNKIDIVSTLTVLQGLSYLENDSFDGIVIVSDTLRDDLVRFVRLLGKNEKLGRIPVLVLTVGKTLQDSKIAGFLSAGANSILTQDEMDTALVPEISELASTYHHTENMRRYLNRLISTVTKDSVRICTKQFFDIHFYWLCQHSTEESYPLALIAFRFSNPAQYAATDRARLKSMIYASLVIRDIDILTRAEADCLVIACPAITKSQCQSIQNRILKIIRDLPSTTEDQNGYRGLCIKSAIEFHEKPEPPEGFMKRTLNNMKTVKKDAPPTHAQGVSLVR